MTRRAWTAPFALTLTMTLALCACDDDGEMGLCDGVDCGGHGDCVIDRVEARCVCDDGYETLAENRLTCVPVAPEGFLLVDVGGGFADEFYMGSPDGEAGRAEDETRHAVVLYQDFLLYDHEVTRQEFESLMGYLPADQPDCRGQCPVSSLSWHEAAAYCNALSAQGLRAYCYDCEGEGEAVTCAPDPRFDSPYDCPGYRLPTEAEWEYAARADVWTATYNGDLRDGILGCEDPNEVLDSIARFCQSEPRPVGEDVANDWGFHDMLGNVEEWCHDWYDDYPDAESTDNPFGPPSGVERAHRGGSYDDEARSCRAAARGSAPPGEGSQGRGFRPARTQEL